MDPEESTKPSSLEASGDGEVEKDNDWNDHKKETVNSGLGWFINEDDRLLKGTDFATKEDDMFKLIKHLKVHFAKGDMYRYLTADNRGLFFQTPAALKNDQHPYMV